MKEYDEFNNNKDESKLQNDTSSTIYNMMEAEKQKQDNYQVPHENANVKTKKEPSAMKSRLVNITLAAVVGFSSGILGSYVAGDNNGSTVVYQNANPLTLTSSDSDTSNVAQVASAVSESVVEISTQQEVQSSFLQSYVSEGAGSGVIYTTNGYIVTNNHVIEGATTINVTLNDGTTYPAELVARDSKTDIAVIKIEKENCQPIILGDSDTILVGETAIAVGNPLGELGGTVTNGIISALDREITLEDGHTRNLLQTNAEINEGNSGGGLFNAQGELIGLVVAKSSGTGIEGIGFAIPVNDVKEVVEDLLNTGYVSGRPALGVSVVSIEDYQTALSYGLTKYGVYVAEVVEGSAAEKAGIVANDYIVAIDDQIVESFSDLSSLLDQYEVNDTIQVQIERNREIIELEVTLQESTAQN